jgi:DNA ligase-1
VVKRERIMDYKEIADFYERIEGTSKRLEMAEHLSELLGKADEHSIDKLVYLTQAKLGPDFEGLELGLAERLVIKGLSFTTGIGEKELEESWREKGDLGLVGHDAIQSKKQTSLFSNPLTLDRVYDNLKSVATASGSRSQDTKIKLLADLLHDASPIEAKYIIRTVIGKMRLGIADMTIIDSLAQAFASKEDRSVIERAYNVCSDLGRVAKILRAEGLGGMEKIKLEVNVPLRAMLAERLTTVEEIFEKMGEECAFEFKYDGLRIQAHIEKGEVRLFSRNLEEITEQFPEVIDALSKSFSGNEGILEGECVPVNPETGEFLPFQEVSHRRGRKHELKSATLEYPVNLMLFDCLYFEGKDLTTDDFTARRKKLESAVQSSDLVKLSEIMVTGEKEEADEFFEKAIERGCEGLMAKSLGSEYKAGSRGFQWIKYKREYKSEMVDTADLVVVGAFAGRGRRKGKYGALLMASYDPQSNTFRTVCKLGSGFDDATLDELPKRLEPFKLKEMDARVNSKLKADYWFSPSTVLEVRGAELTLSPTHTCALDEIKKDAGLAIRFPRFTGRFRDDKNPEDATTEEELVAMYHRQLKSVR